MDQLNNCDFYDIITEIQLTKTISNKGSLPITYNKGLLRKKVESLKIYLGFYKIFSKMASISIFAFSISAIPNVKTNIMAILLNIF